MGVLEDAIREHLDLKRKHGAPEQELERQEVEALGPARREVAPQEPADEAAPVDDAHAASVGEPPVDDAFVAEHPPAAPPAAVDEPGFADEPLAEQAPPVAEPPPEEAPAAPPEQPYPEEPVEDGRSSVDQPTELFDVDETFAGDTPPRGFPVQDDESLDDEAPRGLDDDDESGDGDVLEDTPEFLQDAPEHDRLWFEQKPPRDFDFD